MNDRRHRTTLSLALCLTLLTLLLLQAPPPVSSAGVIYVDADAAGANNGSSWANARTSLQSGLAVAASGDQIWISEGVYKPGAAGARTATFTIPDGVKVYGGFAGGEAALGDRDAAAHRTVLSGDIDGNDMVDASGVITVTTAITGSNAYHVVTVSGVSSATVLDGVTITGGDARSAVGSPNNYGGGLFAADSEISANDLRIVGNAAASGGGAYIGSGLPTLSGVTIERNLATAAGGGVLVQNGGGQVITHATFVGNSAPNGGALASYSSSPALDTLAIRWNTATDRGGGIFVYGGSPSLANISIVGNTAVSGGAFCNTQNASPTIFNAVLWGNVATNYPQVFINNGAPTFSYSLIQGGMAGTGNVAGDPLFVNPANGDLRLREGSPAIDAGLDAAVPARVTTDLAGDPRFIDGNADDTARVDMGAYEYGAPSVATLTIGNEAVTQGATVRVPVDIALDGAEVYAADLVFSYDSTRLMATGVELGSAATGWLLQSNVSVPGEVRAHLAGASPLLADGKLVQLVFTASGAAGTTAVTWLSASLNEGGVAATLVGGEVIVHEPAVADFSGTPTSGPAPLTVAYTCQGTGAFDTCAWDFGDGFYGTGDSLQHTYLTPGTYDVSVTVSGPGGTDTETRPGYVTVYTPAIAAFSASVVDGLAPLQVAFTDMSTGDHGSWSWSFGDGGISTEENPTHTYASAGTYTVWLTVNGNGGTSTYTETNLITVRLGEISGAVRYWTADRAVPGASVVLSGGIARSVATDSAGAYGFSGLYRGAYTVTPGQGAVAGDAISPYDASLALRHAAKLITLSGYAFQAAEVTLNGTVTAYDASYILRAAADPALLASPVAGVAWQYVPASRQYSPYSETLQGQDYVGLLLGDPSGNWGSANDPTGQAERPLAVLEWQVGAVDPSGLVTATLALISTEAPLYSIRLDMGYDASVQLSGLSAGERTSDWLMASNTTVAGECRIVMAGALPIEAPGTLARLRFHLPAGTYRMDITRLTAEVDEAAIAVRWLSQSGGYLQYLPLIRR